LLNIVLSLALALGGLGADSQLHGETPEGEMVLVFPQDGETRFDNTWGAPRPGGRRHQGTDLMADKMTPVLAAADGVVISVGDSPRAGRNIRIRHAGGWETWYLHLNNDNPGTDDGHADWSLSFAEGLDSGSLVRAGQVIGYVGDSGNAENSGSHTHFELHSPSGRVNPYPFLEDAYVRYQAVLEERRITEMAALIAAVSGQLSRGSCACGSMLGTG